MTNAIRRLSRKRLLMHFVASEAAAKAWVAERRAKKYTPSGSQ